MKVDFSLWLFYFLPIFNTTFTTFIYNLYIYLCCLEQLVYYYYYYICIYTHSFKLVKSFTIILPSHCSIRISRLASLCAIVDGFEFDHHYY